MQTSRFSFITRADTLLGACAALGEDFGFNPLYLRLAFASLLLVNPVAVLSAYFGLFALVVVSRLLTPAVRPDQAETQGTTASASNENEAALELPLAA